VSHGTRQSDSPFLSRLSPACPCSWLPQRRWCAVSILEDHLAGVVYGWWNNSETCAEQPLHSCYRVGPRKLQDTERLLVWSRHFATLSALAAAGRNTFPRQLQTNFASFPNNCCISRDWRLTGYFIMNMWECYLLFELPGICPLFTLKLSHTSISILIAAPHGTRFIVSLHSSYKSSPLFRVWFNNRNKISRTSSLHNFLLFPVTSASHTTYFLRTFFFNADIGILKCRWFHSSLSAHYYYYCYYYYYSSPGVSIWMLHSSPTFLKAKLVAYPLWMLLVYEFLQGYIEIWGSHCG
jgi:hypothetical protein